MEKRYEVFISSTFVDLEKEREKVMSAVLKLDCFPAGMELFPAADASQWKVIQRAIDRCDYYVVLVAGRYGSSDEDNLSYTEKEFDYAVSQGIPILAFVHGDPDSIPAGKTDQNDDARKRLEIFRKKVSTGRLRTEWLNPDDLAAKVAHALNNAIKTKPRPGWVRGTLGNAGAVDPEGSAGTVRDHSRPPTGPDVSHRALPPADVGVSIGYRNRSISTKIHHYDLVVVVENKGKKRLDDWEVDIELPTPLLEPHVTVAIKVPSRSDEVRSLFRTGTQRAEPSLRPRDKREITIGYLVNEEIRQRRSELYGQLVTAQLSVDGEVVATAERPIAELQDF